VQQWLEEGLVDFLAFNDHLPAIARRMADDGRVAKYAERAGVSVARFREIVDATQARRDEVPDVVRRLAERARGAGVRMASHDDTSPEDRRYYQALGCEIAEFPMTREAALLARELANPVIMGAPNVVRGGSHIGLVRAADMVQEGTCSVLASDYFYPAMLAAPFHLARDGVLPIADAWPLVSRNPARAAGLDDRGDIAPGQRADLLLVDDSRSGAPRVVATLVAGELCHVTRHLALH
jgi:alpha-D-ribose 1-methylphosphonate 5-triphosphate diphosphatase